MGNQVKKMGKALMLVLAMLVCFNIGVMAQEIEATMAPENVKEAETTKIKNISLAKTEQLVYCCLDLHPKHINYIIEETGLDLLTVLRDLGNLKRYRLVQETFQNYFSKSI